MRKARSATSKGFSVVEVLLAASIFSLLVTALVGAFLYGQESSALAGARARAGQLADEGLEASRSIRDGAFTNLTDGAHGLAVSGGVWTYSGTQDIAGQFTRAVTVSTVDANTKTLTSTVSWQQNAQRTGTASATTRLTNWSVAVAALFPDGLLVYGDGTTTPKYRTYATSTNTFGAQTGTLVATSGRTFTLRTSPTKTEAIAGYVTAAGVLNVLCFNGTTWTNDWSVTVGGTGTTRRFDIAYETASGDVMVLYSTNTATTNELAYRTKLGSAGCGAANWAAATNLNPVRTSGIVHWVKMAWDRRAGQNLITAIWADASADLSAMVWSGSAWGNEPTTAMSTTLEVVTAAQDVEDFDVDYESLSGDVMVVWSNAVVGNTVRYRACTGGTATCTWSAITTPIFADDATNLDISANPNTDQIVFASIGNLQSDLQLGYWSGTAWTIATNVDQTAATPLAGTKLVSTGWLINGATTRSIVVYNDSATTNIGYYAGNLGVFTVQADFAPTPVFANPQKYYQLEMNPLSKDQLMLSLSDNLNDSYSKRLLMTAVPAFTWTNADGGALVTTLPQAINSPFAFAYKRF